MLKLVDQPNTINTEDYEGAPHTADLAYVQYDGTGEASHMCALWPAEINGEHRVVAVSTEELSALDGGAPYVINNENFTRGAATLSSAYRAPCQRAAGERRP